jgi:hypothetical protein
LCYCHHIACLHPCACSGTQDSSPSPSIDGSLDSCGAGSESRVQQGPRQPPLQAQPGLPRSPLEDLGLAPSPTIDSILEAEAGPTAAGGCPSQQGQGEMDIQLSSLEGSPVAPYRTSLRQWLPLLPQQRQAPQQPLDLVSPGGLAAPQQEQWQQQQERQERQGEGGMTPGAGRGVGQRGTRARLPCGCGA